MPIVLLEGPDGTGKTGLAQAIESAWNSTDIGGPATYIHSTWSEEILKDNANYLWSPIAGHIDGNVDGLLILDRHWLSELIYAQVFRGGTRYIGFHRECFEMFKQLNALNIMCLPKDRKRYLEQFKKLSEEREEMYAEMHLIYDAYSDFYPKFLGGPHTPYDFQNPYNHFLAQNCSAVNRRYWRRYDMFEFWEKRDVFVKFIITTLKNQMNSPLGKIQNNLATISKRYSQNV